MIPRLHLIEMIIKWNAPREFSVEGPSKKMF